MNRTRPEWCPLYEAIANDIIWQRSNPVVEKLKQQPPGKFDAPLLEVTTLEELEEYYPGLVPWDFIERYRARAAKAEPSTIT